MRDYEAVYIFDSSLEESAVTEKLERFHAIATGENGGQVTAVEHWGKRHLAYPIDDRENGYYVVAHLTLDPQALGEFERSLKLDEELLRYLIVVNEGELSATPYAPREQERDEDEDDRDDRE